MKALDTGHCVYCVYWLWSFTKHNQANGNQLSFFVPVKYQNSNLRDCSLPVGHHHHLCVQVVRAKERLEEELNIQRQQEKQQNVET